MTNREMLNALSNKELARLMTYPCQICPFEKDCEHGDGCETGIQAWLESEASDE